MGLRDSGGVELKAAAQAPAPPPAASEASHQSNAGGGAKRAERDWPGKTAGTADPTPTRRLAAAGKKERPLRPNGRKKTAMSFRRLRSQRADPCFSGRRSQQADPCCSGLRSYCDIKQSSAIVCDCVMRPGDLFEPPCKGGG